MGVWFGEVGKGLLKLFLERSRTAGAEQASGLDFLTSAAVVHQVVILLYL